MSARGGRLASTRRRGAGTALVPELPWAMPSRATMAASAKPVLAYFHLLPIYWRADTTTYADNIIPSKGDATFGGTWRQRPYPFVNVTGLTDAMRQSYALDDITLAANIGIDAFSMNMVQGTISTEPWRMTEHVLQYYAAAATFSARNATGFKICPNISMLSVGNNAGLATDWADAMQPLLAHASAWKLAGKPVVCLYNVDGVVQQWYLDFWNRLHTTYGIDCVMIPAHQAANTTALGTAYDSLWSSGKWAYLQQWQGQNYATAADTIGSAFRTYAATKGVGFCGSAGPAWENDRPTLLKEWEGRGWQTLQNGFISSIDNNDPLMMIISWNDHEESHNIRPSTGYQYAPMDLASYYLAWYKTGTPPTITRDAIFYAHRMHLGTAAYDTTSQSAGAFKVTNGPALDTVVTVAVLTAPANVIVTTGGTAHTHTSVPAGITVLEDPLVANDTPTFRVSRAGTDTVPVFSSAFPTRSAITWQDLLYRMGSSTRAPITGVQNNLPQDR